MEGDIVAIEIIQGNQNEGAMEDDEKDEVEPQETQGELEENRAVMSEPTAAPAPGELEQVKVRRVKNHKGGEQPQGRVVGIIRRNWKQYCGSIAVYGDEESKTTQSSSVLVVPVDKKIPRIRINTRQRDHLIGKRILVAIDSWPVTSRNPLGHYVSTLGDAGDKATETAVLLLEHDIPTGDFSGEVLACLPPEGWTITPENSVGRRDLRHLPVMSIDPPGCRDIDDALHWTPLPNGNCEIGIHIADVTYYVAPGTPLDEEAANRSTSTYLVDRRLDMLPKMLTEKLCSLVGHEDRFAFSVLLEVTEEGDIVNADFCKSIIHSVGAHTYGEAQEMLDDQSRNDVKAKSVRAMNRLAKIFRKRRMDAGALTLASPEVRFVLDTTTQNPLDVHMYALKETNALVEEFMLLANITVGKKILRHFPTLSVLRRHPSPSKSQFAPLISAAKSVGFDIKIADSKQLADSLDAAQRDGDDYFNKLLRIVCTRCMAPAQYFSSGEQLQEEWHHYGLATPIYTHFTSPIRRYADVCVHRLLAAAIGVNALPTQLMNKASLHDLTENMNRRHRAAQLAGRASVGLHTQLYFKDHPTVNELAYVIAVHSDKVVVLVPKYGIEGTIWLNEEVDAGIVEYNPELHEIVVNGTLDNQNDGNLASVSVFQPVRVHISVAVVGGQNSDGTGRPTVRILMTEPAIGQQPEIGASASGQASNKKIPTTLTASTKNTKNHNKNESKRKTVAASSRTPSSSKKKKS